jgi:CheY-like chemotaxis protein
LDFSFPVCHLFYYPTQVILVDDDPDFLDAVSLILPRDLSYRLFQSAPQALKHINSAQQHAELIRRVYSSYKTGPFDSDTLTHIEINELYKEVYNAQRFSTPSVVIVDYSMPSMNGLEFCANLTNPHTKRILLTGQADTELAVQAFNAGLIDQFISKKDHDLEQKLRRSIAALQQQYFSNSFKLITDPVIANSQSRFVNNPDFIAYFNSLRKQHKFIEYYLIDEPYSGFVFLNRKGEIAVLLILPEPQLEEHIKQCSTVGAPLKLIEVLRKGSLLPLFNVSDDNEHLRQLLAKDWDKYYAPAKKICEQSPYYCALIQQDGASRLLRKYLPQDIQSYDAHIDKAASDTKFLH